MLISICNKSFKKVRITKKKPMINIPAAASELIDARNKLTKVAGNEKEVGVLNEKISDIEAEINRNKILENFEELSKNPENVNLSKVWKIMNKLWPKYDESLPRAKINHFG